MNRTLKRDGVLGKKTFQSACDSETRALRKMGKITRKNVLNWQGGMPKGLTMSPDEERYIQENQNLSVEQIAKDLGHVHGTITRWRDLLLLPRTKVGRRRES